MSQPTPRAEGAIPTVIKIEDGQDLLEALQDREKKKRLAEMEKRVMEAFEKVKPRMCEQAVKETQEYLDQRDWVKDCKNPSSHPCYYRIKGGSSIDWPDSFYYPNFLVMQAIWPENSTVERIAISLSKHWKHVGIGLGPEHYPMLKDKVRELRLFRGEKQMKYEEWERLDDWFFRAYQQRIDEDMGIVGKDKPNKTKDPNTTPQTSKDDNLDEMEAAAENRVKNIMEKLQKAKEDLRKVQKRKRDHYQAEAEFWTKSSEVFKKKAAKDNQQADSDKKKAEWNDLMAQAYAEKLGRSPSTATATPSGERRPGDGHLDKRQRTTSGGNKTSFGKIKKQW
ncbi:hypothetical protein FNAPI_1896 [Fusarium napiforme]|uniref:Uncharacterized protein n=1 Tax=Fusarium napiforme TaxID=42672 RepID=A0A8H5K111_9HYPO|nr:hypothetical protein FNAPI_1896 [Fusarium napiforme]